MTRTSDFGRRPRLIAAAALAIAAAGCEGDDSGNVMAPSGNSLTPAQVDAALGPEIDDSGSNTLIGNGTANAVDERNDAEANVAQESASEYTGSTGAEQ